jgi:hypothetical protein
MIEREPALKASPSIDRDAKVALRSMMSSFSGRFFYFFISSFYIFALFLGGLKLKNRQSARADHSRIR